MLRLYLLYAALGSTLPWLPMIRGRADVSAPSNIETPVFSGMGEGPDRAAQSTMDIVYYSIQDDASGQAFLGEVLNAADRGVKVRLLLDGKINSFRGIRQCMQALETHPNISCRRYNPAHWLKPRAWHAILHNKIILVDDTHLLTGGRNIGNRYFDVKDLCEPVTYDRDVFLTSLGGEGSVMREVAAFMDRLWEAPATKEEKESAAPAQMLEELRVAAALMQADNPGHYAKTLPDYMAVALPTRKITLLSNPIHTAKKTSTIAQALYALADGAESSVIIQSPYATANRAMLQALSAIGAKAETIYLTNSLVSSPNFFAFSNYYGARRQFLQTGMEIFELQSQDSMHGKSMMIDHHLSVVGSFNLDDRSLYIDTENMMVIDSESFAGVLRGAMEAYKSASLQVGKDNRYL